VNIHCNLYPDRGTIIAIKERISAQAEKEVTMFNIGPWELGLILLVALIVVGPGKLPEVAKAVGKGINEFKKVTSGYKKEFQDAIDDMDKTVKSDSNAAPVVKPASDISEMANNFDAIVKAETEEAVKVETHDDAALGK
jgi:Tat protein translocase TatB subunit